MSDRGRRPDGRRAAFFVSLRGYERSWLRGDLIAGVTVWAILVPQALAYASIAQVSPVVGLYAAPGALLLYAALGSSRVLVVGPDGGERGAVGGHGRGPRSGGRGPVRRAHRRAGSDRRPRRPDRRPAAPRLSRRLHQPAGAQGADHRPRADDHHRPAAEAVRDRCKPRRLLRAGLASRQPCGRCEGAAAARRNGLAGPDHRAAASGSGRPRSARGGRGRHCRGQGVRHRCADRRVDRERPAGPRRPRHGARRRRPAGRRRDRRDADRLHRRPGGGEDLRGA